MRRRSNASSFAAQIVLAAFSLCAVALPAAAEPKVDPKYVAQAREILGQSVGFQTEIGKGKVPDYARYLADVLIKGGFAASDIEIVPVGETAYLTARYRGKSAKKPILLSAHMDVVTADPKDWTRDPFTMIEDGGFLFGRGVEDNKFDLSMMVTTLIRLKAEGFKPKTDLILALSGDEETFMLSTQELAKKYAKAGLVLNGDGGGGVLRDEDGAPITYNVQAGEKTYADYDITFTNPGGHSSAPRKDNAIYDLARAADKIAAYEFPVQWNALTRASTRAMGAQMPGPLGAALVRFSEDPTDAEAIKVISADPDNVGQIRTTCVATMLKGGHALNALPQSATLSVNCRIFPGVSVESVKATLAEVVGDPKATVTILDKPVASDASPLRKDVMDAVRKAVNAVHPGLTVTPSMSSGASDSLYFRAQGVPSFGVSGLYMRNEDEFAHGLNERVSAAAIEPGLTHWHALLIAIAR
jgi:acetylornithine deacetylase/succinyl-diaminopimelate desuccinylase-like protein